MSVYKDAKETRSRDSRDVNDDMSEESDDDVNEKDGNASDEDVTLNVGKGKESAKDMNDNSDSSENET
jgi:hypothetical protein